jgi:hypothetical protein
VTDQIRAPWTPEQVAALNRFQAEGGMHPFTCGNTHATPDLHLVAHEDGWHCWLPDCDYRQDWAHRFMADPDAWPKPLTELREAAAEGVDTCRPVEVDGETIRIRGRGELTDQEQGFVADIVRAAKRKQDAEQAANPWPALRAAAFNAVGPVLKARGEWLRLTSRRAVADAALAAIEELLDVGEEQAWCKTCRRVWEGRSHRCESDAEQRLARARGLHQETCPFAKGELRAGFSCSLCETLDNPATAFAATTPEPGPCPACRRADQAGLAASEQHPECVQEQP